jgi:flavin-dependent dehydrogenase
VSVNPPFDAIVVGAGPAGSLAALRLAQAGARVRLIDRAAFPRDKLCGDTLNPGSLAILDRVGGPEGPPSIGGEIRRRALATTGMTVTGPGRASVSADYPHGLVGAALTRRELDLLLVEAAVAAGAQFDCGVAAQEPLLDADAAAVTGVRVTSRGGTHSLRSRVVIAADGRGSRLASALKLSRFAAAPRRWAYGAYFEGVQGLTSRGEMHIRADGYVGIAPLPGGLANVCVVRTPADGRRPVQRDDVAPDRIVAAAIAVDPELRARFTRASRVSDVMVLGPLAIESSGAGCRGALLAGDAAGFVDPMTGDGMRFALRGGELAAEAALRELESGTPSFAALAQARAREFSGKWRINRALRTLVGSPRALDLAAVVARHWGAPVRYLIGVAGDVSLA